jgi:MFS transporter, PAT family, beta-lactamase induction signal transducer AmpG
MTPRSRLVLFAWLYATEGAPIGFIWWALPTLLRTRGVAVADITALTALLVLPWTFKFLWAPLVDAGRGPRWGFRAWIVTAQAVMGLALVPLLWVDPVDGFATWRALLLLHAVAAATQDVAIDACAIAGVPEAQRGTLNGAMQAGMLTGRSLFGGAGLLLASRFGSETLLGLLIAWVLLSVPVVLLVRDPALFHRERGSLAEFVRHLRSVLARRTTWWGLSFALVSAAAFEAAGQLAGPYLVDRGVEQGTIGLFFGVVVVVATVTGGLVGGRLSDRWGRRRAVALFLLAFVVPVAGLSAADALGSAASTLLLLGLMYLGVGLFTAASYALFMDLTDPRLGGTQFSAFMSATNACESWSAWAGGRLTAGAGYGTAFLVMSAVSLAALPLLRGMAGRVSPCPAWPDRGRRA